MCFITNGIGWIGTVITAAGLAVFLFGAVTQQYPLAFAAAILAGGGGIAISYLPYRYVAGHDCAKPFPFILADDAQTGSDAPDGGDAPEVPQPALPSTARQVSQVSEGDCLTDHSVDWQDLVYVVPCEGRHVAEVMAVVRRKYSPRVIVQGEGGVCAKYATDAMRERQHGEYDVRTKRILPTMTEWDAGWHKMLCVNYLIEPGAHGNGVTITGTF